MLRQIGFLPTLPSLLASPKTPLIHRDLSWLQFNERVLAEARQVVNPKLERAKFLAISASNLDEFFMIRYSSLGKQVAQAQKQNPSLARRLGRIRQSILESVVKFGGRQIEALDLLTSELSESGIHLVRNSKEGDPFFEMGKKLFNEQVLPHVAPPQALSKTVLLSLKPLEIAAFFPGDIAFRIPRTIPQVIGARSESSGEMCFFFLDDLLSAHLGPAFRLNGSPGFIRITRDGDFSLDLEEWETSEVPEQIRAGVGKRELGRPVRLQYSGDLREETLLKCISVLRLSHQQAFPAPGTLCLHGLWTVFNETPEDLKVKSGLAYPKLAARIPEAFLKPETLFEKIRSQDQLLHQPYDSFDAYVAWIEAASQDPAVVSIEQTVYRMDAQGPVISALKAAVSNGKKVKVVIELRARFDELNNLRLAQELKEAGVEVYFGFGKLKIHAKIAVVTRQEQSSHHKQDQALPAASPVTTSVRYTHLSTGNYNRSTSRHYTDFALFTADGETGEDARRFFDSVYKEEVPSNFKVLLSAPTQMHRRLLHHIAEESEAAKKGHKARIVAKVNALVDEEVIEQLYKASNAGVQIDLIVRGACSLVPGVKRLSENIRVISVVDRFLEHSRFYWFSTSSTMYLSSADWMPRNFFSRLEIAFPVRNPALYAYLKDTVIPIYLSDSVKARELTAMGTWKKRSPQSSLGLHAGATRIRAQFQFEALAKGSLS